MREHLLVDSMLVAGPSRVHFPSSVAAFTNYIDQLAPNPAFSIFDALGITCPGGPLVLSGTRCTFVRF